MAKRKPRHIDWRHQFSQLDRYLDGVGGVINVRYSGENCGANAFLEVLTASFETRGETRSLSKPNGVSVRLQRANYKTLYLADIRLEFERKLRVKFDTRLRLPVGPLVTNNSAGRDQDIEVNLTLDADPMLAAEKFEWISMLVDALSMQLKEGRMMIVLDSGSSVDQEQFWASLWSQAEGLVDEGLLLVRMIDESLVDKVAQLGMYAVDCDIVLNRSLSENAIPHAVEDVAALIREYLPDEDEDSLLKMARVYVVSHKDDVSSLHNKLISLANDLVTFQ